MNFITAYSALLVASFSAIARADLGIGPMATSYDSGTNAAIPYWTDAEYTDVQVQLVMKNTTGSEEGWDSFETIFHTEQVGPRDNATFIWQVPEVYQDQQYGMRISASDKRNPNVTGYSALSNWFKIHKTSKEGVLSPGEIVGIVVPVLVLFALVAGIVLFVRRRRMASGTARQTTPAEWRDSADTFVLEQQMAPAEWRDSADTIALEKERARAAMSEMKA